MALKHAKDCVPLLPDGYNLDCFAAPMSFALAKQRNPNLKEQEMKFHGQYCFRRSILQGTLSIFELVHDHY